MFFTFQAYALELRSVVLTGNTGSIVIIETTHQKSKRISQAIRNEIERQSSNAHAPVILTEGQWSSSSTGYSVQNADNFVGKFFAKEGSALDYTQYRPHLLDHLVDVGFLAKRPLEETKAVVSLSHRNEDALFFNPSHIAHAGKAARVIHADLDLDTLSDAEKAVFWSIKSCEYSHICIGKFSTWLNSDEGQNVVLKVRKDITLKKRQQNAVDIAIKTLAEGSDVAVLPWGKGHTSGFIELLQDEGFSLAQESIYYSH